MKTGAMTMACSVRIFLLPLVLFLTGAGGAGPADDGRWYAGAYSFSDELRGFRILSVSGSGTATDPVEVIEEFGSVKPATLVIRAARPIRSFSLSGSGSDYATGFIHFKIVAVNASGQAWIEFAFELQEIFGKPSDFFDGLSFDQSSRNPGYISSDHFGHFKDDFEPYDQLIFSNGHVDPSDRVNFTFFITDFTPVSQFYLVEEPRIPFS